MYRNSGIGQVVKFATALTACVLAGAATCAQAAEAPAAASVRVNYHDLDLATASGSQVLYRRIVSAARKVCAPEDIRVLNEVMIAHVCEANAVERAVRAVHSPQLAALYRQVPQG